MTNFQQQEHGAGHDYAAGSPHIKHQSLRSMVVSAVERTILEVADRGGTCNVLELGAGHGTFTDHIVATGATVEVTEMSAPSATELRRRFRHNPRVTVTDDTDGSQALNGPPVDVVICLSVLHHIPDYVSTIGKIVDRISPGGALLSFQDPLWYPRRSRASRFVEQACYYAWRSSRGDASRGIRTLGRRLRGRTDESNPADMSEYHVVRQGVDENALEQLLRPRFDSVDRVVYWSTQAGWAQTIGARLFPRNTFGLIALGRN